MSYEGYEQWWCKTGHLHTFDCYDTPEKSEWKCKYCGEGVALTHSVDQTNGPGRTLRLPVKNKSVMCTCSECGNTHVAKPQEYVLPENAS